MCVMLFMAGLHEATRHAHVATWLHNLATRRNVSLATSTQQCQEIRDWLHATSCLM